MSDIEFETPAARVIEQFSGQDKESFRINTSLPDLTFLRQLAVQGRLIYEFGSVVNDTADVITIVPQEGSTLFVYRILFSSIATAATLAPFNDGNRRMVVNLGATHTSALVVDYMDALVGDGIKSYTVNVTATTGSARASLFGWTENTSRIRDVTT